MEDQVLMPVAEAQAICPWLLNSRVPINILADWDNPKRDCADWWIEKKLGKLVWDIFGIIPTQQSMGYFPEWDLKFNTGVTLEIKISSFDGDTKLFIETGKETPTTRNVVSKKEPTGLSLTSSDYYMLLNSGKFGSSPVKDVMKLRLIPTSVLKDLALSTAETSIVKDRKKTYGFEVDIKEPTFNDGCLGHFEYDPITKTIDFNSFTKYRKEIDKLASQIK